MPLENISPVINVSDIGQSFEWFENEHGTAEFAGVCWGEVTMFFCKDGQGSRGTRLPVFRVSCGLDS
jgi:hypothetical protein